MTKKHSVASGCSWVICALVIIGLAIYAIVFAICAAVGVGLWFLIRYTWRAFSTTNPDSGIIKSLSAIPPMTRAVIAAIPAYRTKRVPKTASFRLMGHWK